MTLLERLRTPPRILAARYAPVGHVLYWSALAAELGGIGVWLRTGEVLVAAELGAPLALMALLLEFLLWTYE